jgi:general secretion pathway protein C
MLTNLKDMINKIITRMRDIVEHPGAHRNLLKPLIVLVIITLLSLETVSLFYKLVSFPLISPATRAGNINAQQGFVGSVQRTALPSYDIITQRNLFLTTLQAVSEKQLGGGFFGSGQDASTFDLKGTIAGDTSFGFAVMEERGKNKQILCRLGDMVGSAKLIKISRNIVVLRSGDRDITLRIKETPEGQLLPNYSPAQADRATTIGMSVSRREVTEKLGDLKSILSQAVVRPFYAGGAQEGFIISDIKPDSLYQKLGLQNGDIISDVNGKRLQSADDALQMVNLMQSGGSISINIKRNGKAETISYSFQ